MDLVIFSLIILLFSVIIHEIAHGSVAYYLGDSTAKYQGRLTLNPLKHLDPFGSVILPLLLLLATAGAGPVFGWAKPVPVNPYNFRDQKWGQLKVAIAGPAANFSVAVFFGLLIRFLDLPSSLFYLFSIVVVYNFLLGIFNLIPLPPLDGSWVLFGLIGKESSKIKIFLQQYGMVILIGVVFFGLRWVYMGAVILYYLVTGQNIIGWN
jgi:Zn-dependent protease